tara:strand:+ start:10727 stop:10882 length:156 start_codon:yes stop_codon:yes gene_type:complete
MIQRQICEGLGCILGVDWFRWYVGASYETPHPEVQAIVFRFGPFFLHFIAS